MFGGHGGKHGYAGAAKNDIAVSDLSGRCDCHHFSWGIF
jgi:hypothetical protein